MLLATLALLSAPGRADDWPMYRHDPAHTGASAETLKLPLKPAWSTDTGAMSILSSAAVVGNTLYFGTRDKMGQPDSPPAPREVGGGIGSVYALDVATGKVKWRFNKWTDGQAIGWVDSSPAVVGDRLYFAARDNYFYCVTTAGAAVWRTNTGGLYNSSSPAVVSGRIYLSPGAPKTDFICLRASDGHPLWRTESEGVTVQTAEGPKKKMPQYSYSSPAVVGSRVYTAATNGIFYALDATTGDIKWKFNTDGLAYYYSPTVYKGQVYCAPGESNPHLYAVDAAGGTEAWNFTAQGKAFFISSPAAAGDTVYIGMGVPDQVLYAVDTNTKKERWRFPTGFSTTQGFTSSPAVAGGVVFVGAGPETKDSEPSGRLFAVDAKSGKRLWSDTVARPITASPSVSGHRVFVGTTGGVMHAYRDATFDAKSPKAKPPASPTRPKTPSAKSVGAKATPGKKKAAGVKKVKKVVAKGQ